MGLFLGIDAGTQSIKGFIINPETGESFPPVSVHFGKDLPQYNSPDGFLLHENPALRHAAPLMWLDALDLLFARMKEKGLPLDQINGISGSGQQHGTVYLNSRFSDALASLNKERSLAEQLADSLSRKTAPIWMDSTTGKECALLREKFGSSIRERTGSDATERFSGPQIMKFAKEEPAAWENTSVVHLVSSFLASVLAGGSMPIDHGDGAGMNILNLDTLQWDAEIAGFMAPGLMDKLPPCVPSSQIAGKLAPYFEKYGLRAGIPVSVWSGDNPNSLIGCGGVDNKTAVVSLGTSDTLSCVMNDFADAPKNAGHVFGHPAGGFMTLLCFANGSLTREHFRERFGLSYADFDAAASSAAPGKYQMLPYLLPESTPAISHPALQYNFDPANVTPGETIRALLESQILTMVHHAELKRKPDQIRLTGGASVSPLLQQLIADIFQVPVLIGSSAETAALGAAMRIANSVDGISFGVLTERFCKVEKRIEPDAASADIYGKALAVFAGMLKSLR